MDIALDANIIREDLAFEGPQFGELFAYLRRTNSRLVIPIVVRDEAEARFREELANQLNIANRAWGKIRKLRGASVSSLPHVELDQAVASMRARLQKPSPEIRESVFPDLSSIELNDVVQRGIHRRRPASETGEELRDVVVWLIVKRYAKEMSADLAFISKDSGFRVSQKTDELHPDLCEELKTAGVSISFHPDIAHFLTKHALKERPVAESWLSQFLRLADIRSVASGMLVAKLSSYGIVQYAEIDSLELSKAMEYVIAPESSYVEASYKGAATARLTFGVYSANFTETKIDLGLGNVVSYEAVPTSVGTGLRLKGIASQAFQPFILDMSTLDTPLFNLSSDVVAAQTPAPEDRKCTFTLEISARIEKDKMIAGQIDDLQIRHLSSFLD